MLLLEELKKERLERRRRRLEADIEAGGVGEEVKSEEVRVPTETPGAREGIRHGFSGLQDMKREQEERRKRRLEVELEEMGKGE